VANLSLSNYSLLHFQEQVMSRFFPRKLIISRNKDVFDNTVFETMKVLNQYVFQHRVYEFPVVSSVVDTSSMGIPGIYLKKVMMLISGNEFFYFFNDYRVILGRVVYPFNLLRNQDNFLDFILANEVYKQLKKRFSSPTGKLSSSRPL